MQFDIRRVNSTERWPLLSVYVALLACPFVPGAEIGLLLLVLSDANLAPLVYLATVAALCLSFCIGRMVPERAAWAFFRRLGLERAGETITTYGREPRAGEAKACQREQTILSRWLGRVLRFRRLAVVLLINTPGNSLGNAKARLRIGMDSQQLQRSGGHPKGPEPSGGRQSR